MESAELVLFIDNQNVYKCAREAFFSHSDPHISGQVNPIELGRLICSKTCARATLKQVRVYTGTPHPSKEPNTYAAHTKQCNAWRQSGVDVITRPLRYLQDWPKSKAQQKGVDVALAVDFVIMAV